MKSTKYILFILCAFLSLPIFSKDGAPGTFEHKIVAGFNLGATAPIPIPQEVRSIDGWWPQFTPQLGYNVIYNHTDKWGFGSGILLDYKGMGVRDKVKYMYTSVILQKGDKDALDGYFTGRNETRVKSSYVTIPLYATYTLNEQWRFRAGGYASYRFSSQFEGEVWDGYLRTPDPTGDKVIIDKTDKATFNFGKDMRDFDFGLTIGAERKINNKFGVYSNLSWGLTSIFPNDYKSVSFKMYNIYLALGLTYNL